MNNKKRGPFPSRAKLKRTGLKQASKEKKSKKATIILEEKEVARILAVTT